ncbi:MAG: AMP-dependent synthetase/ligase [Euzebya sp.]
MTATLDRAEGSVTVKSVATRIRDWAQKSPETVALREKDFGVWKEVTWAEYWDSAQIVAHALLARGLQAGDRVAIHSENRREWLFADVGCTAVRGITVGLYPTNPGPEVQYLLRNSGTKILIAEDQEQVDKALDVIDSLLDLTTIVYLEPRGIRFRYDDPRLISWPDFLDLGRTHREQNPGAVAERMAQAQPDDVMTLIYTSGTTGPPKGVMLNQVNVEFCIDTLVNSGGFYDPPASEKDVSLSYLPLCHIAERAATIYLNAEAGVQVHFAESIETVPMNLQEVQPTVFFAVPRIWEKMLASVEIRIASASAVKRMSWSFWSKVARWLGTRRVANGGNHTPATRIVYAIGYVFMFRALQDRLGMRLVRTAGTGAAPIAPEVLQWFWGIGVPIYELYGMSENAAVATSNRPGRMKIGSVGEPHDGIEVKIDEQSGEILTRHPAVFAGYWQNPEATAETIDADGWLHTGDVGEWVDGTHIKIVDRIKDIIITAGGKNISPSEIENSLKASEYIKEAVVIGDKRKYLTALIGIELDTVGDWAQRRNLSYTTYRDLSEKQEVVELIAELVEKTNAKFSRVEGIKKFRMLPKELEHEDGEMTATQKVKRSALYEIFEDLVEGMYSGSAHGAGADGTTYVNEGVST